jgi:hypothetical protein
MDLSQCVRGSSDAAKVRAEWELGSRRLLVRRLLESHRTVGPESSWSACIDLGGRRLPYPSVALIFNSAGGTLQWAARYLDILHLPVDLWVMIAQPVVSQDQALFPYREYKWFYMEGHTLVWQSQGLRCEKVLCLEKGMWELCQHVDMP